MNLLKYFADNSNPRSPAVILRRRRFAFFLRLLSTVPRPLTILDIGGTGQFWQSMGFADQDGVEVTLLNIQDAELHPKQSAGGKTRFNRHLGDARAMPQFPDGAFDVVFSNSVIEHVGEEEDQRRMLAEAKRVACRYFIQTPNYYFPLEPHFLFPCFQFLPIGLRVRLLQKLDLGWTPKVPDRESAERVVRSVRLLTKKQLQNLSPDSHIFSERVFGFTKSFVLYGGWDVPNAENAAPTLPRSRGGQARRQKRNCLRFA